MNGVLIHFNCNLICLNLINKATWQSRTQNVSQPNLSQNRIHHRSKKTKILIPEHITDQKEGGPWDTQYT